jgi:hypothetical protein
MKINRLPLNVNDLKIHSEFFKVEEQGILRLWQLFSLYDNQRYKKNYSIDAFNSLVKLNRFSYGAVVTYIENEPSLFFGLGELKNWVVVTRGVELFQFNYNLPIFLGHSLPFAISHAKNNNKSGLFMTFNLENKGLYKMSFPPKKIKSEHKDHEIYKKYLEVVNSLESAPNLVWYQNTEQYLRFMNFDGSDLPWEYLRK